MRRKGPWCLWPAIGVSLTPAQTTAVEEYLRALEGEPYSPPTDRHPDPELLALLVEQSKVTRVNETVVFAASAYNEMVDKIVSYTRERGKITVADGRDLFNTSRKYMLPLLEYLDQQRITRRTGDKRVLR